MGEFDWRILAAVAVGVAATVGGLAWLFSRRGGSRKTAASPKRAPSNKEKHRLRKDREQQRKTDAEAKVRVELAKYRERLGRPGLSGTVVEEAVREDPEAAAKAVRRMMKQ